MCYTMQPIVYRLFRPCLGNNWMPRSPLDRSGLGLVKPVRKLHLKGNPGSKLEVLQSGKWVAMMELDINLSKEDGDFISTCVRMDLEMWANLRLHVTGVDVPMRGRLGFHDVLGFFVQSRWKSVCGGLVSIEKKLASASGFDGRVQRHQDEVKKRFQKLVREDPRISGQLLSVSMVKGDFVGGTSLHFWGSPHGQWERVAVTSHKCEEVLSKLNWFAATKRGPLQGQEVASVGSFLAAMGKDSNHAGAKVKTWANGSIAGVGRSSFQKMKLEQQRGGQGYVASRGSLQKVFPHVE